MRRARRPRRTAHPTSHLHIPHAPTTHICTSTRSGSRCPVSGGGGTLMLAWPSRAALRRCVCVFVWVLQRALQCVATQPGSTHTLSRHHTESRAGPTWCVAAHSRGCAWRLVWQARLMVYAIRIWARRCCTWLGPWACLCLGCEVYRKGTTQLTHSRVSCPMHMCVQCLVLARAAPLTISERAPPPRRRTSLRTHVPGQPPCVSVAQSSTQTCPRRASRVVLPTLGLHISQ